MTNWRTYTREILNSLQIQTSKNMGQNFLIKSSVVSKIVDVANINDSDVILEIGGGVGILTNELVRTNATITVIEKETALAKYLAETFPSVKILRGDALNIDWPDHSKVVANLPYSISSQILFKILHQNSKVAVLMLQKEVADRCIAEPGDRNFSRLSVLCKLHADVKKLFDVSPQSFYPKPKVTSTVLHFELKSNTTNNPHHEIEDLVRSIFTLRRKTLRSVLRSYLKRSSIDSSVWDGAPSNEERVFHLSIAELDDLVSYLKENNSWPL